MLCNAKVSTQMQRSPHLEINFASMFLLCFKSEFRIILLTYRLYWFCCNGWLISYNKITVFRGLSGEGEVEKYGIQLAYLNKTEPAPESSTSPQTTTGHFSVILLLGMDNPALNPKPGWLEDQVTAQPPCYAALADHQINSHSSTIVV